MTLATDRHSPRGLASRRPWGFSLVELLVAIVIVDVALLALVQTTTVVIHRRNEARARAIATSTAANRVEQLLASPCVPASGALATVALTETWSSQLTARLREVADSVSFGAPASRVVGLRTRTPC